MVTSKVGESIARARERCSLLIDVVAPYYPRDVPSTRQYDDWPVTGPAFIARCTRWLQSMLELSDGHESAAAVLARILHEHVTIFAWIAIDPETNMQQWVRKALDEAIKADNDMTRFGRNLLTAERRAEYIAKRDSIPLKWPGVAGMAYEADKYWADRIKVFSTNVYGLRGMYAVLYRHFSTLVHAMPESLSRVVGHGPGPGLSRIRLEEDPEESNAFTNAPFIYAFGLLVSSEVQGFPKRESVLNVFEQTKRA